MMKTSGYCIASRKLDVVCMKNIRMGLSALRPTEKSLRRFSAIRLLVLDVALGVPVNGFEILGAERAPQLAGLAHEEAAGWNHSALGQKGPGGDNAPRADFRA